MFRTVFGHYRVLRGHVQLGALREFQQLALVVHEVLGHNDFLHSREMETVEDGADLFEPAVQVHRPEHRLVSVGEDRFLAPTAHLGLGLADLDVVAQVPFLGRLGAGMAGDHGALALGKVAFGIVGVCLVQVLRGQHVEHGIAQELQTFVVVCVREVLAGQERPMHQGMGQQFRIAEPIPELRLKPVTGLLAKPEL